MYRYFTIALLLFIQFTFGQTNLVPNPSFEDIDTCDRYQLMIPVQHWFDATGCSADYYNDCDRVFPFTAFGNQFANTGDAYVGFYTFVDTVAEGREYISVRLKDSLKQGRQYVVSFYCLAADFVTFAHGGVGVLFTDTAIVGTACSTYSDTPQVFRKTVLSDTTNWTLVQDTMTARGGELFITIGNFFVDSVLDTIRTYPPLPYNFNIGYYYVDDVSVIEIPEPVPDSVHLSLPNVFTPNDDDKNRLFLPTHSGIDQFNMKIYNRWGAVVFETDLLERGWDGRTFAGKECPDGTYFHVATFVDVSGNTGVIKGAVHVFR